MGRNLVVELQEAKSKLYKDELDAQLELAAANAQLAKLDAIATDNSKELELQQIQAQEKYVSAEIKQLTIKLKLKRAQFFGIRIAKGPDPYCVWCFVDQDVHPRMSITDNIIAGIVTYKCTRCGKELDEDEPIIDSR